MEGETDERLMERYAGGEAEAFAEIFGRYEGRAFRFFLSRTRSDDRAWDLYQDLFLRLHRFRRTYRTGAPFAPWFFQIARRVLVDQQRGRGSRPSLALRPEPRDDAGKDAERRVGDVEQAERILSRLSPEQAFVILAAKVEGRDSAEIARHLEKSVSAVKQVASRALRRLRAAEGFAG